MRRFIWLVIACWLGYGIYSTLNKSSAVQNTSSSFANFNLPPDVLHVTDLDGNAKDIALSSTTSILYMATWCPHSKALKQMLNDPTVRSAMAGQKVVAIFGRGEWKEVRSQLSDAVKAGEYTQQEYQTISRNLAIKEKQSMFFDPSFFDDLTVPTYIGAIPSKAGGYPSAQVNSSFYAASEWLNKQLNIPAESVNQLYAHFDPPDNSSDGSSSASNSPVGSSQ
jgi:hypothetical protein